MTVGRSFNATRFRWTHQPGRDLTLTAGECTLVRYCFEAARGRPYLHPVCSSEGVLLTGYQPHDHPWHLGLWFSWKYLNGVHYWVEETHEPGCGRPELIGSEQVSLQTDSACVSLRLRYRQPDGVAILEEARQLIIHTPRSDGNYAIDWRHTFIAQESDVVFDRTPITPETPWGGYAGLSWRLAESLGTFHLLDSEGREGKAASGQRARWADLSAASNGSNNPGAGMAFFDHPGNPRHPTHWHAIMEKEFGYLNAAFVLRQPFVLSARDSLSLVYRVFIHGGLGNVALLEKEYLQFLSVQGMREAAAIESG